MAVSLAGLDVFFITVAVSIFLLALLHIVRLHLNRHHLHYQQAHTLDEEEPAAADGRRRFAHPRGADTEMTDIRLSSSAAGGRQRGREGKEAETEDLFPEDEKDAEAEVEFDRDELDQLQMLSQLARKRPAGSRGDDDDDDDELSEETKDELRIDVERRPAIVSLPTQPLASPAKDRRLQSPRHQQQQVEAVAPDEEKQEEKAEQPSASASSSSPVSSSSRGDSRSVV